ANGSSSTASVFLGTTIGTFPIRVDYTTGQGPNTVAIADFTNDGNPDIAVVNGAANTVSLLPGNGNGTFQSKVDFGVGSSPRGMLAFDLNHDNRPDLVVTNTASNNFSVLLDKGVTHFGILGPASATAGASFGATIAALDASNRVDATYRGTIHFTSSD